MVCIPTSVHFSKSSIIVNAVNPIFELVGIYSFYIIPLKFFVVIQPSKIGMAINSFKLIAYKGCTTFKYM